MGKKGSDVEPLIFIPGPPGNHHAMLYFARKGAMLGHRVIIPDMNGIGASKGNGMSKATFDHYATVDIPAIINEVADAFGGKVYLGGICGGGGFSVLTLANLAYRRSRGDEYAKKTMDKLAGLVTLAVPIDFSREEKFKKTWRRFFKYFPHDRHVHRTSLIGKVLTLTARKKGDEELYRYIRHSYRYGVDDLPSAIISKYFHYFDTFEFLIDGVDCMYRVDLLAGMPVLMVSGRGDEFFSYRALMGLCRKLKQAGGKDYVYVVIKDLGHIPVVGSKCDLVWEKIFDPWITGRHKGITDIKKLVDVDDRNIVGRAAKYEV